MVSDSSDLSLRPNRDKTHEGIFTRVCKNRPHKEIKIELRDSAALGIFLFIGMFSRVFRLQFPRYVVFDEVHFGRYIDNYRNGNYFYDIHPPLARLLMFLHVYLVGNRDGFLYERLQKNNEKYPGVGYVALRTCPAFFAGFCPAIMYITARVVGCSFLSSILVGLMVTSEISMIVQGRFILTDGILHFFSCCTLLAFFVNYRKNTVLTLVIEALLIGCSCSIKFTAGGLVLFAFASEFLYVFKSDQNQRKTLLLQAYFRCCLIFIVVLACLIGFTAIHLELLPYTPEDKEFITPLVNGTLINKNEPNYTILAEAPSIILRSFETLMYQLTSNLDRNMTHPYSSKWYQWSLLTGKNVLFWTNGERMIVDMGSPLLYWPVFFILIAGCAFVYTTNKFGSVQTLCIVGYLCCLLPFMLVPRVTFIYHYTLALLFGILHSGIFMDRLPPLLKGFFLPLYGVVVVAGYFIWAPLAYGLEEFDFDFLQWNQNWL